MDPYLSHRSSPVRRRPGWNSRPDFSVVANPQVHPTYRRYFTPPPPPICGASAVPRDPTVKTLVSASQHFYLNHRDPRFFNPSQESGWNNRITPNPMAEISKPSALLKMPAIPAGPRNSQDAANPSFGVPPSSAPASLTPFPGYRFQYLRKHTKAPMSPFLAAVHGFDVPPELYMSKDQAKKVRKQILIQEYQQGNLNMQSQSHAQTGAEGEYYGEEKFPFTPDQVEAESSAAARVTFYRTAGDQPQRGDTQQSARSARSEGQNTARSRSRSPRKGWNDRHHIVRPAQNRKPESMDSEYRREQLERQRLMAQQEAEAAGAMTSRTARVSRRGKMLSNGPGQPDAVAAQPPPMYDYQQFLAHQQRYQQPQLAGPINPHPHSQSNASLMPPAASSSDPNSYFDPQTGQFFVSPDPTPKHLDDSSHSHSHHQS